MSGRVIQGKPLARPVPEEDPFADLLEPNEAEETLRSTPDGDAALRSLFGAPPAPPAAEAQVGVHWPTHNYGPAYEPVKRPFAQRTRRHAASDVWDVEDVIAREGRTPQAPPTVMAPPPAEPASPWPAPAAAQHATAAAWLDAIVDAPAAPTEAQMVATLHGRRPASDGILVDLTETLVARRRVVRVKVAPRPVLRSRFGRAVRGAFLVIFALAGGALLQLLLM